RLVFSSGLSSSGLASALASGLASSGLATAGVTRGGAARARLGRAHEMAARTATDHTSFCIAATLARLPSATLPTHRNCRWPRPGCDVARRDRAARVLHSHDMIGQVIGSYRIVSELGKG